MWVSVQKILNQKIRALGWKTFFDLAQIEKNWDKLVGEALGKGFSSKSKPLRIANRMIMVRCLSSVWANEFQIKEGVLLDKIKKRFPEVPIDKIKFLT